MSRRNIGFATLALLVGIAFIINGAGLVALGWAMHAARGGSGYVTLGFVASWPGLQAC